MNSVGMEGDVRTMLHEAGHAFHDFELYNLPYVWQRNIGMEIAEVASMSMELLSFPYLGQELGGFFDDERVKTYKRTQLEQIILFWPYMAIVDGFQHWAYTNANLPEKNSC
jgi:oligoendopeptidase F